MRLTVKLWSSLWHHDYWNERRRAIFPRQFKIIPSLYKNAPCPSFHKSFKAQCKLLSALTWWSFEAFAKRSIQEIIGLTLLTLLGEFTIFFWLAIVVNRITNFLFLNLLPNLINAIIYFQNLTLLVATFTYFLVSISREKVQWRPTGCWINTLSFKAYSDR